MRYPTLKCCGLEIHTINTYNSGGFTGQCFSTVVVIDPVSVEILYSEECYSFLSSQDAQFEAIQSGRLWIRALEKFRIGA